MKTTIFRQLIVAFKQSKQSFANKKSLYKICIALATLTIATDANAQSNKQTSTSQATDSVLRIPYAEGKSIFGILSMPTKKAPSDTKGKKKNKHGVAIVSHGFNGSHQFGRDYFKTLNDLGYAVYTFDFPCGSIYSMTDKNTMNMSILDEKQSLKTVVQYFRKQKDVDSKNIILIGESQGGLVSALTAAELKNKIKKMILIYPALCIVDDWNKRYPNPEAIPDTTKLWNVPLGKRYFHEARTIDTYGTIGKYTGPVLIVHGDKDPVVPISYAERATKTYTDVRLKVIKNAGHGFKPAERVESNNFVREFLCNE